MAQANWRVTSGRRFDPSSQDFESVPTDQMSNYSINVDLVSAYTFRGRDSDVRQAIHTATKLVQKIGQGEGRRNKCYITVRHCSDDPEMLNQAFRDAIGNLTRFDTLHLRLKGRVDHYSNQMRFQSIARKSQEFFDPLLKTVVAGLGSYDVRFGMKGGYYVVFHPKRANNKRLLTID